MMLQVYKAFFRYYIPDIPGIWSADQREANKKMIKYDDGFGFKVLNF